MFAGLWFGCLRVSCLGLSLLVFVDMIGGIPCGVLLRLFWICLCLEWFVCCLFLFRLLCG